MTAEESRPWRGAAGANGDADTDSLAAGAGAESCLRAVAPLTNGASSLLSHHVTLLEAAAIPKVCAEGWGIRSVTTWDELPEDLKSGVQSRDALPGLVFPWTRSDGSRVHQLRPDAPVEVAGVSQKYLQPPGVQLLNVLGDCEGVEIVLLVEGTKQAYAAAAHAPPGVLVVGIAGCYGWSHGGQLLLELTELVEDRKVVVAFDADLKTNPDVWTAAHKLTEALILDGATDVRYVGTPGDGKTGLDDVLGRRHGLEKRRKLLARLIERAAPRLPKRPPAKIRMPAPSKDGRPRIDVGRDRLEVITEIVDEVVQRWDGIRLFDHGGVISELQGHQTVALDKGPLMTVLAETAVFSESLRSGVRFGWPDGGVIQAVTAQARRFRPLDRVCRVPFVRGDGTICQTPGYDPPSRTVLVPDDDLDGISVPLKPTERQVTQAAAFLLEDWLGDMPFAGAADRANALALILPPFIRGLVPLVPLAVGDGRQMGVGKNLLVEVLTILVNGENSGHCPTPETTRSSAR